MRRVVLAMLLAALLVPSLSACGRKAEPFVPEGQTDTLKRKYPSQE